MPECRIFIVVAIFYFRAKHSIIKLVCGKFALVHVHAIVIESIVEAINAHGTTETNTNPVPNPNPNPCCRKLLVRRDEQAQISHRP